jgi:hypothetical protein
MGERWVDVAEYPTESQCTANAEQQVKNYFYKLSVNQKILEVICLDKKI